MDAAADTQPALAELAGGGIRADDGVWRSWGSNDRGSARRKFLLIDRSDGGLNQSAFLFHSLEHFGTSAEAGDHRIAAAEAGTSTQSVACKGTKLEISRCAFSMSLRFFS